MFAGCMPFDPKTYPNSKPDVTFEELVAKAPPPVSLLKKRGYSEEAIELVTQLLEKDPDRRLSMAMASNHPWLKKHNNIGTKSMGDHHAEREHRLLELSKKRAIRKESLF